jgi:amino acid permease
MAVFLDLSVIALCGTSVSGYVIVVGNTFKTVSEQVARAAGGPVDMVPAFVMMWSVSLFLFLPLCLLRDLSSLKKPSALGNFAIVYVFLVMLYRLCDGSYQEGGKFYRPPAVADVELPSSFAISGSTFALACVLSKGYVNTFMAPIMKTQLADSTSKRFDLANSMGFGIAGLIGIVFMLCGAFTFGKACKGNIMDNYHPDDHLSMIGSIAISLSATFCVPLSFAAVRESLMSLVGIPEERRSSTVVVSLLLLSAIGVIAGDLGKVQQLQGALFGPVFIICPCYLYLRICQPKVMSLMSFAVWVCILFGLVALIGGVGISVVQVFGSG